MNKARLIAAIASFLVVGLGQIIRGEKRKGLKLMLAVYFVLPSAVYLALLISGVLTLIVLGLGSIAAIIIWAYSVIDAFTYEKIN
ncbi:hypothetical protein A3K48_01845 [candidate division WOR-1 bacterium RIFOXYA12_FULL_52_29]|uniref:DUF5683 domain-containing protein n=1 Tax=candidate division WOR-1 bacterium RIFOXYC12_FULL_54_18 TaxID=1802584 RepID=A0A1F4T4R0_UNCSA|nr:MAG: hypothetical protein A3K44_01845 [candidate division WOR-1 bacterium RIFOXYA2_FULL_51_19]OGC17325.1 MAG: hypothetical protein A3K48_01845 [candidate division WOR-1 bacterium RIFOXYA12_FULL_52_29]OGC26185.1 MAG: hypothetical protein A3K32_01840 [candidate division WOR-1 bacterium RIFOXYB2_FULL_45_9]OGC27742.1 MAG: hypothetical protein A3K49_01845 [candidate division WOR-1 bacterium RIFOXYC12_FULL_54_18]OGC29967.1 MAG: hypothetical protein A2346_04490 [candidate division WOR-1 bacterium R